MRSPAPQPFMRHEFLSALHRHRLRRRAQRLAAAVPAPAPRGRARRRRCRSSPRPIPTASTCSTGPGPTRTSATASTTTRSCVCAVPFTPVRGPRLLAAGDRRAAHAWSRAALELARETLVAARAFRARRGRGRLLARARHAPAPHGAVSLANEGYARLRGLPRAACRTRGARTSARSAAACARPACALRWLEGAAIERAHWEFFNRCYRATYAAHRSSPYLSLEFFLRIGADAAGEPGDGARRARRPGRSLPRCFLARCRTRCTAATGARSSTCRSCTSNAATTSRSSTRSRRGIEVFEGGAQGEHKIFRGLLPVETLSAHWLAHPRFARAVEAFLEREGAGIAPLRRRAVRP